MLAQVGGRLDHLAVHGQVHQVLALLGRRAARDEAELDRRLLHALGEVALVEGEAQLAVLEHVVGARLVVAALGGVVVHE